MLGRRLSRFATAVTVVFGATALTATVALADVDPGPPEVALTCAGFSGNAALNPGIPAASTVNGNGTLSGCAPGPTSGAFVFNGRTTSNFNCAALAAPTNGLVLMAGTAGSFTITWSDGTKSTGPWKIKQTAAVGVVKLFDKINSGKFFLGDEGGATNRGKVTLTMTPGTCPGPINAINLANTTPYRIEDVV
jgi:hypothetical protein